MMRGHPTAKISLITPSKIRGPLLRFGLRVKVCHYPPGSICDRLRPGVAA